MSNRKSRSRSVEKYSCAQCAEPIASVETVVGALGKTWHVRHFTCAHCKKPITESTFREQGGQPYCEVDYARLYGRKCSACGQDITKTILTALGRTWHQDCFRCSKCKKVINLKEFTEKDGQPYCIGCL